MDDVERMLAQSLHGAATDAPGDTELLSKVHRRSSRYRRRRLAVQLSGLAAVVVVGLPATAVLLNRSGPPLPPPAAFSSSAASPVTLVEGFQNPVFPYALPPTEGMRAPVATLEAGTPTAFFEATDLRRHADTMVTVTSTKPVFTTAADESAWTVRGHQGRLRTIDVEPAKQYILYWPEAPGRWLQLATDDTYTPQQVVALANALTSAAIEVLPPFELDYSPAGLTPDTVDASTMSFRDGAFSVVLRKQYQLPTTNQKVAAYDARLTRDARRTMLEVAVTDWDAVLQVTVRSPLAISDNDLLRFAAGVHILNRSNPR
ncbi:hypothetical protein JIG36_23830 [Actinoplanes sp. LDG1-06]|uniref:Uncharacterized protein n=1 Tax=Paractinoplanes ovalisporus TaxID=2810368 RepID=A0ABS2AH92_9ACTN|nr:hypothetical protein [Actinoplanes ovalisporus]MBM2618591.1 hypothetical protein [Actinoplanes ovalisporus]